MYENDTNGTSYRISSPLVAGLALGPLPALSCLRSEHVLVIAGFSLTLEPSLCRINSKLHLAATIGPRSYYIAEIATCPLHLLLYPITHTKTAIMIPTPPKQQTQPSSRPGPSRHSSESTSTIYLIPSFFPQTPKALFKASTLT